MNGYAILCRTVLFLLLHVPVAYGETVLVTAHNGPVAKLSRKEAEQLYLGHRTTLDDGTPVMLADLPTGAERNHFYSSLTGKNPSQIRAHWSRQVFTGRALPPREAANLQQAQQWIAETPGMIGYLPDTAADGSLTILLRLP